MNKYYVYGTNSDLIEIEAEIEADNFTFAYVDGFVCFFKGNNPVAIFNLNNIVGVYEIEEGDKK